MILDGKKLASIRKDEMKKYVAENGLEDTCLAVVQVGNDPASDVYVRNKQKACDYVGIKSTTINLSERISQHDLIAEIDKLNKDEGVDGILVQLPLPDGIDEDDVIDSIDPKKDVDGFHPINVGNMFLGKDTILPCTPSGIMDLLYYYNVEISGKTCVVVGRSNIVGKPVASLLTSCDGTVTLCHSKTKHLRDVCKSADILVVAVGKTNYINSEYIKPGATVIDVGINRKDDGKLCGDVNFDEAVKVAENITPVPGGVGPMTVAMLVRNCVYISENKRKNKLIADNIDN